MGLRHDKKRQEKQRAKVAHIVKKFKAEYFAEVQKVKDNFIKVDDLEHNLTELNVKFLSVWRGVVQHVRVEFPLSGLDGNYFDRFIIWGDECPMDKTPEPLKITPCIN